ncbi:hypothetical protein EJ04DRAFT_567846 [Polyplosphaeria fusca]|uniref:CorA-like transporter domain-containing protein n=1 Tax=Polyplosphaeria fusca TaxID=682080 RepID=A0A9P4QRH6_9PLEO|nr:hypothetical protein EJ04DRAFT_567846 [Polyplosphaeria fusca]
MTELFPAEGSYDPYTFDIAHFERLLSDNCGRIFVSDDEVQVKVIEVGHRDHIFTNVTDLQAHLETSSFRGTRIILIPQRYSWDRLTISEAGIRLLLNHFHAFPAIIDVLSAFGRLTSESSDSLGGCYSWKHDHVSEFCYLIKNVEQHGRENSEEPWSIRQLGVYHRHDSGQETDTFIILNPMTSFQQRLKDAQIKHKTVPTWRDIHMLALSHATWQWRWYLSFWESQLNQLISKAHVSRVEGRRKTDKMPVLSIEYSDFQDVQVIHDRMNVAKYVLDSNARICKKYERCFQGTLKLEMLLEELELQGARVDKLLERTRSGSGLMQEIISFRGLDSLKVSSENSNQMAQLAGEDSSNMLKLTTKAQRDSETLKKITILTMVYLPASFVAQFLSMGYLKVNSTKHPASLNFASEMWIFAFLTLVLFAITFALWWYLDTATAMGSIRTKWWRRQPREKLANEKV